MTIDEKDTPGKLATELEWVGLPVPVREFRFAAPRKFMFDLAWPDLLLAVEIEGGVWIQGRHTRGSGFVKDIEKYNLAVYLGWRVLRFTTEMVVSGFARAELEKYIPVLQKEMIGYERTDLPDSNEG